ncbi:MAG: leucine-rich repeat protein [Parasporobacterium sp.]|nr:leucine-rich repeat protein [Parasporobacterium sp.]
MTKKMLKRIVAVMIAACLCLEIFAVQAAESDVFTEDTEFTAVETEEVSVNEQADPELPVLEVLPEDLPELSGEEITEPETPELPVVEVTPETNPEDLPELSVLEEQPEILPETESETDPEEQPQLPVEEEQPEDLPEETETETEEQSEVESEEPSEAAPETEPEVQPEAEKETAETETETEAETETETETEEELEALNGTVTSISVAPVEIEECTCGSWQRRWEDDVYIRDYYRYYDFSRVLQFTIVYGGETITGTWDDIYAVTGEFPYATGLEDQSEEQWTVGNTYHGMATLMGASCEFDITITPSLLTSFEAVPYQIIEKTNGFWTTDDTGTEEFYYYRTYNFEDKFWYNIVYDGQQYSGTANDLTALLGEYVYVANYSDQDAEHWTAGNSYHATAELMSRTCDVEIQILPSPVDEFSVEPVSVFEGTMGYVMGGFGDSAWYSYNVMQMPLQFTVKMSGETFTGTAAEVYAHFGYSISLLTHDQPQNHWTANNTYTVGLEFMGMETELQVSILPSPVTSFIVNDIENVEETNGYFTSYPSSPGEYTSIFIYTLDLRAIPCEVTYNGTYTGTLAGLEDEYGYIATIASEQTPPNQWTVGNTYTATAWFMGKTCDFNVTITEDLTEWEIIDGVLYIYKDADMQNWVAKTVPWFTEKASITKVVIEDGVKKIGSNAFNGCVNLTEAVIPDSVAYIGAKAFAGCSSLAAINIPDQVSYIDQSAFYGCSQLTGVSLPSTVTKIVYYTFQNCTSLESIDIPVSVKTVNPGAFNACSNLTDVNYGGTESDRAGMVIGRDNEPLLNATWHYQQESILTGWQQIDGKWYYYNADGVALTGWQKIGSKWYYMDSSGVIHTGWVKVGKSWYYMNSSGVMQTGWAKVSGKWYYLGTNGVMRTGWQEVSGKWYYLGTNGVMRTGWQEVSDKWYYFGTDGIMRTGWQKVDEKWYYLGTDGVRTTGWQKISKKWYYMGTDGVMTTGWKKISKKWYYFGTDGVMCTGWKKISSKWYYFNSSGVMVTGTQTIDGKTYHFDSSGVWID